MRTTASTTTYALDIESTQLKGISPNVKLDSASIVKATGTRPKHAQGHPDVANGHKNTRHGNAIAAQTRHLVYIAKAHTQHGITNA